MDIRKTLLAKSLRELLTITACLSKSHKNGSHRHPRGRDQKGYKLTVGKFTNSLPIAYSQRIHLQLANVLLFMALLITLKLVLVALNHL